MNVIGILYLIVFLGFVGWCINVYKLATCDFSAPHNAEVIRAVGVFVPPVGALIGYMSIED